MKAKLGSRSAVFMIIGGDLVLLLLGWVLLVSPARQTVSSITRATQAAQAEILQAQHAAQAPANPVAPKQPEIRTAALYELAKAMPTVTDMPDVLLELDQVARASGVTVGSITPGGITPGNGFGVLSITIGFSGDFYSLTDLLYRLRTLVSVRHGELDAYGRLFSVGDVGLTPTGAGNQLNASITVNTFVYGAAGLTPTAVATPPSTDTTATDTSSTTTTSATPSADAAP